MKKINLQTIGPGLLALMVSFTLFSCKKEFQFHPAYLDDPDLQAKMKAHHPVYPNFRMAHLSDLHIYDVSLGTEGKAFQAYLEDDRKMLVESASIVQTALNEAAAKKPDFIFLTGDLTKDGERINHELLVGMLNKLEDQGNRIYTIPGNHDIRNGDAMRFLGDTTEPVANIEPAEFAEIYNRFGYNEALERDPASLSYVAEPIDGLWLLGLDSNRYMENEPGHHPITDGRFSMETLAWIESMLKKSVEQNKAVLVGMHHGILEHYSANDHEYTEYVLDDSDPIARMFAAYGARVVFTGHYHAQDITLRRWRENGRDLVLYDVETGSPVTYPSPYRIMEVKDGKTLQIRSYVVQSIPMPGRESLQAFGHEFLLHGTEIMANNALKGYHVSDEDIKVLSPWIAKAYVEHLKGDESGETPGAYPEGQGPGLMGMAVLYLRQELVDSWRTDLEPMDNNVEIPLTD